MARTGIDEILRRARSGLDRLSPEQAHRALDAGEAVLVDTRVERCLDRDGRIPGALELSLNVLEWRLDPDSPSRIRGAPALDDLVVVVCEQGYSSSLAAARLQELGFARATDVIGGFEAWVAAGLPVEFQV